MSYPWLVEGQTRGGWTFDNILANSNHLSGTAVDLNWNKYPFRLLTMPHDKVVTAIAKDREQIEYELSA